MKKLLITTSENLKQLQKWLTLLSKMFMIMNGF